MSYFSDSDSEDELKERQLKKQQLKKIYTGKDEKDYVDTILDCYKYLNQSVQDYVETCYRDIENILRWCEKIDKMKKNDIPKNLKQCPITLCAIKIPVACSIDGKIYELGALLKYFVAGDKIVTQNLTVRSPVINDDEVQISFKSIGMCQIVHENYKSFYDKNLQKDKKVEKKKKFVKSEYEQLNPDSSSDYGSDKMTKKLELEKPLIKPRTSFFMKIPSDNKLKKEMHLKIDKLMKKIKCSLSIKWFCGVGLLNMLTCCIMGIPVSFCCCVDLLCKHKELEVLHEAKQMIDVRFQLRNKEIKRLEKHCGEYTICCCKVHPYFTKETKDIIHCLKYKDFGYAVRAELKFNQQKLW
ncbi:MAG: hypothetical protein PVI75_01305 [Gammaproteobacteria bacterium]|jgi:hypothetical protein